MGRGSTSTPCPDDPSIFRSRSPLPSALTSLSFSFSFVSFRYDEPTNGRTPTDRFPDRRHRVMRAYTFFLPSCLPPPPSLPPVFSFVVVLLSIFCFFFSLSVSFEQRDEEESCKKS